jgi:hypothetical protein
MTSFPISSKPSPSICPHTFSLDFWGEIKIGDVKK